MHLCICLPPLPEVGCPKFLEIWNPWGKVLERSGFRIEHFCWEVFFADFALQNMVETTLPDGLETSGRKVFAFWMMFSVFQKTWVLGILGPPYCGIGATIRFG